MKIDATPPPRPTAFRKPGSPAGPPRAASRHDHSFHSPEDIRVDVVMPTDADSHDGPDFEAGEDEALMSRDDAIGTAQALGDWLARHALSLTSHNAARLQHLFAS